MNQITKYLSLFFTANLNCFNKKDLAIKPVHGNEIPELKTLLSGIYFIENSIQRDFLPSRSLNF